MHGCDYSINVHTPDSRNLTLENMETSKLITCLLIAVVIQDSGCDGIAGSGAAVDQCGICGGNGKSCQIVSGIFMRRHLDKYGYNLITKIPSGACNINVTEMSKSRNYLALKISDDNGLYFLNGNNRLSPSGDVRGAGTTFRYGRGQSRDCPGECLFADGPTNQNIEVQLLYYHQNPGIIYQFTIPKHKVGAMMEQSSKELSERLTDHRSNRYHNRSRTGHRGNTHHGNKHHDSRLKDRTITRPPRLNSGEVNRQQSDMHTSRRQHRRQRIIARRRDAHGTSTIQHGQSPRYIPAYDRKQSSHLSHRRLIPRTYPRAGSNGQPVRSVPQPSSNGQPVRSVPRAGSNGQPARSVPRAGSNGQPVRSVYADRYANGLYRTNSNPSYVSNTQTDRRVLPHSQTLRGSNRRVISNRRILDRRTDPDYVSPQRSSTYRTNRNKKHPNYLGAVSNGGHGYSSNNIQQIPYDGSLADSNIYAWKISGFSECSRTCGGGVQETKLLCVKRSSGFVVTEENCDPKQLPKRQTLTCSNQPCPAGWQPGEWGECSRSCGKGIQSRTVECQRRISPTLTISVSASLCLSIRRPAVSRMCQEKPCAEWKIGQWEKCSTECGMGERARSVKCVSVEGKPAHHRQCEHPRPEETQICDMGSCAKGWYHTKWAAECSAECGNSHYKRKTYCSSDDGSYLPEAKCSSGKKPRTKKACKNNPPCGGKWFSGPWTKCNATCGHSVKTRDIVCMKRLGSKLHTIVSEVNCVAAKRPTNEEVCPGLSPCRPEWYMTPWGQCSASCGTGVKTREVKCLDLNLQPSPNCRRSLRPSERQSCNKHRCHRAGRPAAIRAPNRHIQKDAGGGGSCRDRDTIRCPIVKQARLCKYEFYRLLCCKSCHDYVSEKHH